MLENGIPQISDIVTSPKGIIISSKHSYPNNRQISSVCIFCGIRTHTFHLFRDLNEGIYSACNKCYDEKVEPYISGTGRQYCGGF
jgi:hypothetical protein